MIPSTGFSGAPYFSFDDGDCDCGLPSLSETVNGGRYVQRNCEMLFIPELHDDYDFDKTYEAVIDWCQKAFVRIKQGGVWNK